MFLDNADFRATLEKARVLLDKMEVPGGIHYLAVSKDAYLALGGDPDKWETYESISEDGSARLVKIKK